MSGEHLCLTMQHFVKIGQTVIEISQIFDFQEGGNRWRGGLVVSVLDQRPRGRGFESRWLQAVA